MREIYNYALSKAEKEKIAKEYSAWGYTEDNIVEHPTTRLQTQSGNKIFISWFKDIVAHEMINELDDRCKELSREVNFLKIVCEVLVGIIVTLLISSFYTNFSMQKMKKEMDYINSTNVAEVLSSNIVTLEGEDNNE